MATKYQFINDMYEHTLAKLTENQSSWLAFLQSACRSYKCRFDEQVLIYAQRPDAIAVLEIERWNRRFGRWVNKNAKGIAVFNDGHKSNKWLRYYFDISDTHESSNSRPVPIWNVKPEYESEIIESIENSFGDIDDKSTLATALFATASNVVEDNITDYLRDLMDSVDGSALDGMDEAEVEKRFRAVVNMSVEYMLFSRCGLDTEFFSQIELGYFSEFNTMPTINALGLASSDIAEMVLSDISVTIINIEEREKKQNRTFAKPEAITHNVPTQTNIERSVDNGTDISASRRRNDTKPQSENGASRNPWQIRISQEELSEAEPQTPVLEPADIGELEQPSLGDRADSLREDGNDNQSDGSNRERDGGIESERPDEVDRTDEQHQSSGRRNDTERTDIQLEPLPTVTEQMSLIEEAEEEKTSAFSISQQIIDEVLTSGGNEENSTMRIVAFFKKDHVPLLNTDFLKREYDTGGKGFMFDGSKVSVWFDESGIRISHGETVRTADTTLVTWEQAAKRIRELLDLGRYMPQKELDKVDDFEIKSLAEMIWNLQRDCSNSESFAFMDSELFNHGYPDDTASIYKLILDPEEQVKILNGITNFAHEVEKDASLLRFRGALRNLDDSLDILEDLQRKPLVFTADNSVSPARPNFITQDEVDKQLIGGSGMQDGKFRIYSFFLKEHTTKEKADFIKNEYGTTGGYSRTGFSKSNSSKGMTISRSVNNMPYDKIQVAWNTIASRIDKLITENRYMSQQELDHIPEYEKGILTRDIYHFYYNQPEEVSRPYARSEQYYEAVKTIRPQLDDPVRVAEIVSQMATILDGTSDMDRRYESMKETFANMTDYQNGTFTLFSTDKPTVITLKDSDSPAPVVVIDSLDSRLADYINGLDQYEKSLLNNRGLDDVLDTASTEKISELLKNPQKSFQLMDALRKISGATTGVMTRISANQLVEELKPLIPQQYEYQLGSTVYIGTDEFEIAAIDDESVRLFDVNAPLFSKEMPRSEFDEKVAENPMNEHLLVPVNQVIEKEQEQTESVEEQIQEELAEREFIVSDELIKEGLDEYSARGGKGNIEDIADFIEDEFLTEEPELIEVKELDEYIPKVGDRYEIEGRIFTVDSCNPQKNNVSLRDTSFEGNIGFPIFRPVTLDFIRTYDPIREDIASSEPAQESQEETLAPSWEKPKAQRQIKPQDPYPNIPISERHNFQITDDDLGAGGQKTKFKANIEAIRTLQTIENENRLATPNEQEILSRYVGWGGLQQAFDASNNSWTNEYQELSNLLTPNEYSSARATTLNAHYTSPTVIKAMYKAIENIGFKTGNILEPACGTGNFLGLLPDSMNDSKVFGVELDSITGRIAKQLYQKNNIAIQGFETTDMPDSFFDLAIGNVPFGSYKVPDKKYDKHGFSIHDYFFAKSLDKVRPGGIVAFVTSMHTMDKQNNAVRKYIAERADLLGAIRLPNNAFSKNAGTEVTTDIIFLQKRDRVVDIEPDWVHLGKTEEGFSVNSYFIENPEMILGTLSNDSGTRMYGREDNISCVPYPDTELSDLLSDAITNIHAEYTAYERGDDEPEEDNTIPADPTVRNYSYTLVDGQIYFRQDSRMVPVEMTLTAQNRVKGLIELRECVRNLVTYQTDDYPDSDIIAEQSKLNRLYDSFAKKYGLINSRGNSMAFAQDSSYCLLCALEVLDENGELDRKADMFTKRTIKPYIPITHVDTAVEALAVSLSERAKVDLTYMSSLSGISEDDLAKELEGIIFKDVGISGLDNLSYVTADEYLSGNVRDKLRFANAAAITVGDGSFDSNVKALEAVVPEDLTAAEISVRLGTTWLPQEVVQEFVHQLIQPPYYLKDRIRVLYSQHTGTWNITEKTVDRSNIHVFNTYGTQRMGAYHILENTLNLRDVRIFDKIQEPDGTERRILNKKETAIAMAKQDIIRNKFDEWIWADPDRRERLCRIYNDRFNSTRPRIYDGSHLTFPGMNPEILLRKHQIDAIARVIYGGNTLLAHEVGAGKTFEMVASAMESKRLGLCNKSLIVVPNHITEQWAGEFLQLYPSAKILVATKKDFETKNRKKFCARIATGDYDAVIIGHSQFERIPISRERQQTMLENQIDDLVVAVEELKANRGERSTVKQLERLRKSLSVRLEKLNDQSRKDDVIDFEELGVDRLFIDEAHHYKNLFLVTKMRNVGGIAQTEAQKSSDLYAKCRYLDELTNGRGTVFATGTPISNSMVEMYTMQRYLQYDNLVRYGLQHFDAWASTFGETVTAIELAPEGTGYRAKTRFAKFHNLPELMSMFRSVADIQTADMLKLPVPEANFHTEVTKPSDFQKEMIAGLADRAEIIRNGGVDPAEDNMLKVTNDGRKLALDQRIINPMLPDDPHSKVNRCVENVFGIWEQHKEERLSQLVFSDLSTPKGEGTFSVYNDIRDKLIARGVPKHEIAFIHDADTDTRKKELFAKVRKGKVRVLLGSTPKMGSGTNVQDKLIALHDLDCPWRPSDLAQRLGRIVRQGNKNPVVEIFRYVTEGTFDSYLYQLVENKQKFIAQIMTSKLPVRSAEDVDETALSYAEIKALATGNPLIIEKCQLEMDVNKLKILHASHLNQKYSLEDKILKEYPREIKRLTERIEGYKADRVIVEQNTPQDKDKFPPMKIGGILYSEKAKAGKAILDACKNMTSPDPVPLGEYRGFPMTLSYDPFSKEYKVKLTGTLSHDAVLSTDTHGNITRLDNVLDGLEIKQTTCETSLDNTKTQLEAAKGEQDRPFTQEQEFNEKTARLKEVNILLSMDQKDRELLDMEPDENDLAMEQKNRGMAR